MRLLPPLLYLLVNLVRADEGDPPSSPPLAASLVSDGGWAPVDLLADDADSLQDSPGCGFASGMIDGIVEVTTTAVGWYRFEVSNATGLVMAPLVNWPDVQCYENPLTAVDNYLEFYINADAATETYFGIEPQDSSVNTSFQVRVVFTPEGSSTSRTVREGALEWPNGLVAQDGSPVFADNSVDDIPLTNFSLCAGSDDLSGPERAIQVYLDRAGDYIIEVTPPFQFTVHQQASGGINPSPATSLSAEFGCRSDMTRASFNLNQTGTTLVLLVDGPATPPTENFFLQVSFICRTGLNHANVTISGVSDTLDLGDQIGGIDVDATYIIGSLFNYEQAFSLGNAFAINFSFPEQTDSFGLVVDFNSSTTTTTDAVVVVDECGYVDEVISAYAGIVDLTVPREWGFIFVVVKSQDDGERVTITTTRDVYGGGCFQLVPDVTISDVGTYTFDTGVTQGSTHNNPTCGLGANVNRTFFVVGFASNFSLPAAGSPDVLYIAYRVTEVSGNVTMWATDHCGGSQHQCLDTDSLPQTIQDPGPNVFLVATSEATHVPFTFTLDRFNVSYPSPSPSSSSEDDDDTCGSLRLGVLSDSWTTFNIDAILNGALPTGKLLGCDFDPTIETGVLFINVSQDGWYEFESDADASEYRVAWGEEFSGTCLLDFSLTCTPSAPTTPSYFFKSSSNRRHLALQPISNARALDDFQFRMKFLPNGTTECPTYDFDPEAIFDNSLLSQIDTTKTSSAVVYESNAVDEWSSIELDDCGVTPGYETILDLTQPFQYFVSLEVAHKFTLRVSPSDFQLTGHAPCEGGLDASPDEAYACGRADMQKLDFWGGVVGVVPPVFVIDGPTTLMNFTLNLTHYCSPIDSLGLGGGTTAVNLTIDGESFVDGAYIPVFPGYPSVHLFKAGEMAVDYLLGVVESYYLVNFTFPRDQNTMNYRLTVDFGSSLGVKQIVTFDSCGYVVNSQVFFSSDTTAVIRLDGNSHDSTRELLIVKSVDDGQPLNVTFERDFYGGGCGYVPQTGLIKVGANFFDFNQTIHYANRTITGVGLNERGVYVSDNYVELALCGIDLNSVSNAGAVIQFDPSFFNNDRGKMIFQVRVSPPGDFYVIPMDGCGVLLDFFQCIPFIEQTSSTLGVGTTTSAPSLPSYVIVASRTGTTGAAFTVDLDLLEISEIFAQSVIIFNVTQQPDNITVVLPVTGTNTSTQLQGLVRPTCGDGRDFFGHVVRLTLSSPPTLVGSPMQLIRARVIPTLSGDCVMTTFSRDTGVEADLCLSESTSPTLISAVYAPVGESDIVTALVASRTGIVDECTVEYSREMCWLNTTVPTVLSLDYSYPTNDVFSYGEDISLLLRYVLSTTPLVDNDPNLDTGASCGDERTGYKLLFSNFIPRGVTVNVTIVGTGCTLTIFDCSGELISCDSFTSLSGDVVTAPFAIMQFEPGWSCSIVITRDVTSPSSSPAPSRSPTTPTKLPTSSPTEVPTRFPTQAPTFQPSKSPSKKPTAVPTASPVHSTSSPLRTPTRSPTRRPTRSPTPPTTFAPSANPTVPTEMPTITSDDNNSSTSSSSRVSVSGVWIVFFVLAFFAM